MDSDNQKYVFCSDHGEYRIYSDICDKLYIERVYKKSFEIRNTY